jgi:four helix bundle protein
MQCPPRVRGCWFCHLQRRSWRIRAGLSVAQMAYRLHSGDPMKKPWDLRERTMEFAVAVFRFCRTLPSGDETRDIARQLRRAGSGVGANYRAVRRGRSSSDFAAKLGVVIEEADECCFWLDLLVRIGVLRESGAVSSIAGEANELVAIFTAAQKTARQHNTKNPK